MPSSYGWNDKIKRFFACITAYQISSLIVFVAVVSLWFVAWQVYNQEYDVPSIYRFPTQSAYVYNSTIESNEQYNIVMPFANFNLALYTTSFSAQNPIFVQATLIPQGGEQLSQWKYAPEKQDIMFPYASVYPPSDDITNNNVQSPIIELTKYDDPPHYYGEGEITYMFEGKYSYDFISPLIANTHDIRFMIFPIDPNNDPNHFYLQQPEKFIDFTVSSSDATSTVKTNDIFESLTLVLVGFGFIEAHALISSGVSWLGKRVRRHKIT